METKIDIHDRSLQKRIRSLKEWDISLDEKKRLLRFLDELQLGKVNKGVRVSESRACKYLDVLRTPLEFFKKPTIRLTAKDVERFERSLSTGEIVSSRGGPYQHSSKVDIRRALKVYLRWRLGDSKARELAGWLDTRT